MGLSGNVSLYCSHCETPISGDTVRYSKQLHAITGSHHCMIELAHDDAAIRGMDYSPPAYEHLPRQEVQKLAVQGLITGQVVSIDTLAEPNSRHPVRDLLSRLRHAS